MKLDDLRDQLKQQAWDLDGTEHVPLDAVRHRAHRIHRSRVTTAVAGAATVIVLAAGIAPAVSRTEQPGPIGELPNSTTTQPAPDGLPSRIPPTSPNDYVRDGVRFRARVTDSTLRTAMIGEPGQTSIQFTASTNNPRMMLRSFCSGSTTGARFEIWVDGKRRSFMPTCSGGDPQQQIDGGGYTFPVDGPVRIEAQLIDKNRKPVTDPTVQLGVGAYAPGTDHAVGVGGATVPEVLEHNGYDYRLANLQHSPARHSVGLELPTPAGTPFLVLCGGTDDLFTSVDLDGINTVSGRDGVRSGGDGFSITPVAARAAGRVGVYSDGKHDKGDYVLALYLPTR